MDIYGLYVTSAAITSILSLFLNFVLLFLIVTKTSREMKAYCHVLVQNSLMDIFLAFILGITLIQFEVTDTTIFFRTAFPWFPRYGMYPCVASWLYVSALFTVIWSMFIQALFRYCMIVRKVTLSRSKTWLLQLSVLVAALINTLPYLVVPCANHNLNDNIPLLSMTVWKDHPSFYTDFRSQNMFSLHFLAFIVVLFVLMMTSITIFFLTTIRVKKALENATVHFTIKTLRAHRQFGRRMILQSIPPSITMIAISAILAVMFAMPREFTLENGGLILLGLLPTQYITVVNPVITILSIKSYREAIFCGKYSFFNKVSTLKPSVKITVLQTSVM